MPQKKSARLGGFKLADWAADWAAHTQRVRVWLGELGLLGL